MRALFSLPRQKATDNANEPLPGARLFFYQNHTSTPKSVYVDADLNIPHTNPVIADAYGLFPAIWLDIADGYYTVTLRDANNVQLYSDDDIGAPQTDFATIPGLPYDLQRAGLVPNNSSAATRAANTAALIAALDPTLDGVKGWVILGNSVSGNTYYFDMGCVEIRDGVVFDGQNCMIDVAGDFTTAMNLKGFLTFINDVQVENCRFNVNYDGSAGSNNGMLIRIGMRDSYPFGNYAGPEQDLPKPMANNRVVNNRFTTNNPTHIIGCLGGLQNNLIRGNTFDGSGTAHHAISYEFGALNNLSGGAHISTHALNFRCVDNVVSNLDPTMHAVSIVGAMTAFVDGLWTNNCGGALIARVGEAFYYNMVGTPTEGMGHKAHYDLRGIYGRDNNGVGITLQGAQAVGGYLAGELNALSNIAKWTAQTDLISFVLDGFYIEGNITVSGRSVILKHGIQTGGDTRGIHIQTETPHFAFENVQSVDNDDVGFASDISGNIWSPTRLRTGYYKNCKAAGNGISGNDAGFSLGDMDGVVLEGCTFGKELVTDGVAETTQGAGVALAATCSNVTIRNCHGAGTATTMYAHTSTNGWQRCKIESCSGVITTSGPWTINGYGEDAAIGNAATTLTPGVDLPYQRNSTELTADRVYTLDTATAVEGDTFHVTRDAATPGTFTLSIGGIIILPVDVKAWGAVVYRSAAWKALGYGVFP